ncbi:MAG: enoyl-CoA hydratase/isomerase family protein [Sphingomonadales bacterium]|nr:enoyl-CoA hydratase/isomerase family protein [Sphingomonadales bacterium]
MARITLNRPAQRNAISLAVHRRLGEILDEIEWGGAARAVLLTGNGPAFCAGQDLSERKVETATPEALAATIGESIGARYNPLVRRLRALPVPWICAVNGAAAGAGASFAFLADLTLAAESARFSYAFSKIGLMPDCGGSWVLPRLAGTARAMGMALTGEAVTAKQAEAWGLIWKAVPDAELADAAEALARQLADGPTAALVATREAIRGSGGRDLDGQLDHELEGQIRLAATADYGEGVRAFKEKRAPRFRGR